MNIRLKFIYYFFVISAVLMGYFLTTRYLNPKCAQAQVCVPIKPQIKYSKQDLIFDNATCTNTGNRWCHKRKCNASGNSLFMGSISGFTNKGSPPLVALTGWNFAYTGFLSPPFVDDSSSPTVGDENWKIGGARIRGTPVLNIINNTIDYIFELCLEDKQPDKLHTGSIRVVGVVWP